MVDVACGVVSVDLEADLIVASGNHGIGESGCQDAAVEEGRHKSAGLVGIAQHQGHDGVLTGNDLVTQRHQVGLEPASEVSQVFEKRPPLRDCPVSPGR